jgi:hypothetical protein
MNKRTKKLNARRRYLKIRVVRRERHLDLIAVKQIIEKMIDKSIKDVQDSTERGKIIRSMKKAYV